MRKTGRMGPTSTAETIVLVEGESDRLAVLEAARVLARDLDQVEIVAMGGATNVGAFVRRYAAEPHVLRIVGLCDRAERRLFNRALPSDGVFVCVDDLEDEFIRALGSEQMIDFIDVQGELRAFRTMQKQPAQRDRSVEQHLHRFFGTRGTRKIRYAAALPAALGAAQLPPPVVALLNSV